VLRTTRRTKARSALVRRTTHRTTRRTEARWPLVRRTRWWCVAHPLLPAQLRILILKTQSFDYHSTPTPKSDLHTPKYNILRHFWWFETIHYPMIDSTTITIHLITRNPSKSNKNSIKTQWLIKACNESLLWINMITNRREDDQYTWKNNNPHKTPWKLSRIATEWARNCYGVLGLWENVCVQLETENEP